MLRQEHERIICLLTASIERGRALGEFRTDLPAEQLAKSLHVFGAGMLATAKAIDQKKADSGGLAEFALGLLS